MGIAHGNTGVWPIGMWTLEGFDAATTAMRCSVQSVRFGDGTLWQRSPLQLQCFTVFSTPDRGYCEPIGPAR